MGERRNQAAMKSVDGLAIRTQRQVAEIMTERGYPMSKQVVFKLEKRAMKKLLEDRILRAYFEELV